MKIAKKSNPRLWEKIKNQVKASSKGGKAGQWSARKAQLAIKLYKQKGGKFSGRKTSDNALKKWTGQDWQYVGKPKKSRYLPKAAISALSRGEKAATSRAKVKGGKNGKQFVKQPKRIARKTAKYRR